MAKDIIPKEIAERVDKRGFSAPLNRWFGWDNQGKYNRGMYKNLAFNDWKQVFLEKDNKTQLIDVYEGYYPN